MNNASNKVKMVKLGDVCEQLRGVSYKKSDATDIETGGYIPVLRANNIDNGRINFDSLVYVPKGIVKDRQIIKKGDVVIAASSGSISVVGKGAQAAENLYASFGAFCKLLRPNAKVNPRFFGHFFQSKSYRHIISNLAAGANINNLKNEHLDDLDFPDIPLPEQKRIAEVLDLADAARRKRRENLKLYDDLIRSLFLKTFGDPVSNPMGWELKEIGAFAEVSTGKTPSRAKGSYYGGKVPWVKTTEVDGSIIHETSELITEKAVRECGMKKFPENSLLIAMYGQGKTRGKSARLGIEATTNQACGVILPSSEYSTGYLETFLYTNYETIRNLGRGGNQPNLNLSLVRSIKVLFPPLDLQNQFAEQVKEINAQKAREQALCDRHDELFNALLQRAFRGEL